MIINSDAYLKVENTSVGENKIVEIKGHVPKDKFIVKRQCKSFEKAIASACHSLERKYVKKKQKPRVSPSLKFL